MANEDYCITCGWCADDSERPDIQPCVSCGDSTCHECRDKTGGCGYCAEYKIPKGMKVVPSGGSKSTPKDYSNDNCVEISVLMFYGVGVHYFVDIYIYEGDERINFRQYKEPFKFNTMGEASLYIGKKLKLLRKKKKKYIKFEQNEPRQWFYKEGD